MPPRENARLKRRVQAAYVNPGHVVAYSAPATVAKHFGISKATAKKWLEELDGYTLHREYKQPKYYNPYFVHGRREQVQADLIDVSKIAGQNDGVRFLLVLIDIFTKKVWVYPLERKTQGQMKEALTRWLASLRVRPAKLVTDQGTEFTNRPVQQLLRANHIGWQAALGTLKAAVAERVNKTLQILIYKHLSARETTRYVDVLQQLVRTYNTRPHRTLEGMTPEEADRPRNEERVQAIFHDRYYKIGLRRRHSLPLKVGDMVRIKTEAKKITSSSRAYAEQFHGEYFTIARINRTLPIAMYHLRSMDTREMIRGGFYANELQRQRGDTWKVERVVQRRTRNGVRQALVKWKYFGDQWNSWIPEAELRAIN